jgi:hypothetical protein
VGLIAGVAVYGDAPPGPSITSRPNAFAIQVEVNDATAGTVTVDVDDFAQGTLSGTASGRAGLGGRLPAGA